MNLSIQPLIDLADTDRELQVFIYSKSNLEKKIDIFIQSEFLVEYKERLFLKERPLKCKLSIFTNIDNKLINFNSNDKYSLKSYKQLDLLKSSKKLDYNINIC